MTNYIQKDATVEAIKVPYNEWGDNPMEWPEVPDWLQEAFTSGQIVPEFRGEDYWYYKVIIEPVGVIMANPDYHIVRFPDGSIAALESSVFNAKFVEITDEAPGFTICPKCGLPIISGDNVLPDVKDDGSIILNHKECPDVGLIAG